MRRDGLADVNLRKNQLHTLRLCLKAKQLCLCIGPSG